MLIVAGTAVAVGVGLQNPGFDSGLSGWTIKVDRPAGNGVPGDGQGKPNRQVVYGPGGSHGAVVPCAPSDRYGICLITGVDTFTTTSGTTKTVAPRSPNNMVRLGGPYLNPFQKQIPYHRFMAEQTFTVDPAMPDLKIRNKLFTYDSAPQFQGRRGGRDRLENVPGATTSKPAATAAAAQIRILVVQPPVSMFVVQSRPSAGLDDARVMGGAGDPPDVTNRAGRGEQAHGAAVERRRHADRAAEGLGRPAERDVVRADGHGTSRARRCRRDGARARIRPRRSPRRRASRGTRRAAAPSRRAAAAAGPGRRARRPRPRSAMPDVTQTCSSPGAQTTSCARNGGWIVRTSRGLRAAETSRTATCVAFVPSATQRRRPSALNERWRAGPGTVPGRRPGAGRDRSPRPRPRFDSLT